MHEHHVCRSSKNTGKSLIKQEWSKEPVSLLGKESGLEIDHLICTTSYFPPRSTESIEAW
jgi:hypothetical protein